LFTPDDRLQQEAEGGLVELFVGCDGGVGVEEEFSPHRNHPGVTGQLLELREGRKTLHELDGYGKAPSVPDAATMPNGASLNVLGN
jgi:hypothetical protein